MASSDNGTRAVMGEAVAIAAGEVAGVRRAAEGEQLGMFPLPTRLRGAERRGLQRLAEVRNGPGRPAGAVNRSTKEFREYLLGRGISPLVQMMRWALHTPESLAIELSCSKLEALRELRAIWAELAPYLHSRMQPTDDQGQAVPSFQLVIGGQNVSIGPGAQPPWEYMQNQPLSEPAPAVSHGAVSHEESK